MFINSNYVKSGTDSNSGGTSDWVIGLDNNWQYRGYISNARITIGQAIYTKNFTPPTVAITS